jgi:hypothetical protein
MDTGLFRKSAQELHVLSRNYFLLGLPLLPLMWVVGLLHLGLPVALKRASLPPLLPGTLHCRRVLGLWGITPDLSLGNTAILSPAPRWIFMELHTYPPTSTHTVLYASLVGALLYFGGFIAWVTLYTSAQNSFGLVGESMAVVVAKG